MKSQREKEWEISNKYVGTSSSILCPPSPFPSADTTAVVKIRDKEKIKSRPHILLIS